MADIFDEIELPQSAPSAESTGGGGDIFDKVVQSNPDLPEIARITRTEGLRSELTKRMQDMKMFPSFTAAATGAADKNIRRNAEGKWDLPVMTLQSDSAVANFAKGLGTTLGQKTGDRLRNQLIGDEANQIRSVFENFQKDNNLSDGEVQTVWSDLVNRYRRFEREEMFRVQSDGSIEPNPMSSGILDTEKATKAINESGASDVAKRAMIAQLPQLQGAVAENKAKAIEAYAEGDDSFRTWLARRSVDVATGGATFLPRLLDGDRPEFERSGDIVADVKAFEKIIEQEPALREKLRAVENDLGYQGLGKLGQQFAGLAGMVGSERAAEAAGKMGERMALAAQGGEDLGLLGDVLKEVPSVAVQALVTRGAGAAAGRLPSATAARGVTAMTAYATAGMQSAGLTFADEYQAALNEGATEDEAMSVARTKAARAGLSTALITSAFGTGKIGGVESAAAGRAAAEMTLRDLATMAGEKGIRETVKSAGFRQFARDTMLDVVGEATEEGLDQLTEAFINADPDTNLADAWDQAVEAGLIGGIIGGTVSVGASAFARAQAFQLEMQAREGGASEAATAAQEVETAGAPDMDVSPVGETAPTTETGQVTPETAKRVADIVGSASYHLDSAKQNELADQLESLKESDPETVRKSLIASGMADDMDTAALTLLAKEVSSNGDAVVSRLRENATRNAEKEAISSEKTPEEKAAETIRTNEATIARLEATPTKTTKRRKNAFTGEMEEVPLSEERIAEAEANRAAFIQKLRDENAVLRGADQTPEALQRVADNTATPEDVAPLVEQGLVEQIDGQNVITEAGVAQMETPPRLTPEERRGELTGGEPVGRIEGDETRPDRGAEVGAENRPNVSQPEPVPVLPETAGAGEPGAAPSGVDRGSQRGDAAMVGGPSGAPAVEVKPDAAITNDDLYETLKDTASLRRSQGRPDAALETRIAAVEAARRGVEIEPGKVYSNVVVGHPQFEAPQKELQNLVPIVVESKKRAQQKFDTAYSLMMDIKERLGKRARDMMAAKTPAKKKAVDKKFPEYEAQRLQEVVDYLQNDTLPELDRLIEAAPEQPQTPTPAETPIPQPPATASPQPEAAPTAPLPEGTAPPETGGAGVVTSGTIETLRRTRRIGDFAGQGNADVRAAIMSEIAGKKIAKSKAGYNAFVAALADYFGVTREGKTIAAFEADLKQAIDAQPPLDVNKPPSGERQTVLSAGDEKQTPPQTGERWSIYEGNVGGEKRWFVQQGDEPGTGDTIWRSREEAKQFATAESQREAAREAARTESEAKEKQAAIDKEAAEELGGFETDLSPIKKGQARKALSKWMTLNGKNPMSRRDHLRRLVADGYRVTEKDGERVLQKPGEDSWFEQRVFTKIGFDYAEHLTSNPDELQRQDQGDRVTGEPVDAAQQGQPASETGSAEPTRGGERNVSPSPKPPTVQAEGPPLSDRALTALIEDGDSVPLSRVDSAGMFKLAEAGYTQFPGGILAPTRPPAPLGTPTRNSGGVSPATQPPTPQTNEVRQEQRQQVSPEEGQQEVRPQGLQGGENEVRPQGQEVAPETPVPDEGAGDVAPEGQDIDQTPPETPPTDKIPTEPPPLPAEAAPTDEFTLGIKKAKLNEARARLGLKPLDPNKFKGDDKLLAQAFDELARDPEIAMKRAEQAAAEAKKGNEYVTNYSTQENVTANLYEAQQQVEIEQLKEQWQAANLAGDKTRADTLNQEIDRRVVRLDAFQRNLSIATSSSGSAFRTLQRELQEDYSFAGLSRTYQTKVKRDGTPLTPEETAKLAAAADTFRKEASTLNLMSLADSMAEAGMEAEAERLVAVAERIEEMAKEAEENLAKSRNQITAPKRAKIKKKLNTAAEAARKRLEEQGWFGGTPKPPTQGGEDVMMSGLDPQTARNIRDAATVMGAKFADKLIDGTISLQEFTVGLIETFGEKVRPFSERIYEETKKLGRKYRGEETVTEEPATIEEVLDEVDGDLDEPTRRDVTEVAKFFIADGKTGLEVMELTHAALEPMFPDLTRETVETIFTGYGTVRTPDQSPNAKELRRIKELAREKLKQYDLARNELAKLTGYQRDETDPEVRQARRKTREMQKEVEEFLRSQGIEVPSDTQRQKTGLQTLKRRMANEIAELRAALKTDTPMVTVTRNGVTMDEDATKAKKRLDVLRKLYDRTFPSAAKTHEQKVEAAIKTLDRQIAEEQKMIAAGIAKRPAGESITSPEIEARREKLAKLRATRRALDPENTPLGQAKKARAAANEKLRQAIETNNLAARRRTPIDPDAELQALIDAGETLRDEIREMRKALSSPENPTAFAERTKKELATAEKRLAEVERMIEEGDIAVRNNRTPRATDPAVARVRNKIKEANKRLAAMRREAMTEEERAQRFRKSIDQRIADLQRRVREGDTSPRTKKPKPLNHPIAKQARIDYQSAVDDYNEFLLKEMEKNMTLDTKAWIAAVDGLTNFPKGILASLDISGFGKQGLKMLVSNPHLALSNYGKNFRWSNKLANETDEAIRNDPDFDDWIESGGQYKSWRPGADATSTHELYRSRLAHKIPFVKKLIGGSEKGYVTYLNSVAFAHFKMMKSKLDKEGAATKDNLVMIADLGNMLTGTSTLRGWEKHAPALGIVFWAPKFLFSQFEAIKGVAYSALDASTGFRFGNWIDTKKGRENTRVARKLMAIEHAKMTVGYIALGALLKSIAHGLDLLDDGEDNDSVGLSLDPRSTDFMKFRWGERRIDFGGGLLQALVFGTQFITGQVKRKDGTIEDIGDMPGFGDATRGSISGRFARSKLSPLVGSMVNLTTRKNYIGEPVYIEDELIGSYIPLPIQEYYEAIRSSGFAEATIATILSAHGFTSSQYGPKTDARYDSSLSKDINEAILFPVVNLALAPFGKEMRPNRYEMSPDVGPFRDK